MNRLSVLIIIAAISLSGCNAPGSAPAVPSGSSSQSTAERSGLGRTGSSSDLAYVGTAQAAVEVYSYPGLKHQQTIHLPAGGDGRVCTDSKGNVFVGTFFAEQSQAYVYEYAHGGSTPVETLTLEPYWVPAGCSVDSVSGNLAVSEYSTNGGGAKLAIYDNAQGAPTFYTDAAITGQPGYDGQGNLFMIDHGSVMAELPAGSTSVVHVSLSSAVGQVDRIQWDGTHLALTAASTKDVKRSKLPEVIHRLSIAGSSATIVSTITLRGLKARATGGSWIIGSRVLAPMKGELGLWKYPAGGRTVNSVRIAELPASVTISAAP